MNVELSIRDTETGDYLVIPVLPEKVAYKEGNKQANTVDIVDLGTVEFPSGTSLDSMSWSSFFPARYDPSYCSTSNLKRPGEYRDIFRRWKNNGTELKLICPAASINQVMYITQFSWDLEGFEGDIYYQLAFNELRKVQPIQIDSKVQTFRKQSLKSYRSRPPRPKKPKPKTYTVQPGDYLIKIAKKFGIDNWRQDLYKPNKKVIGGNPNLIYPGQKLKIIA